MSKEKKGENVKVVVRCRPMNSVERERGDTSIVVMDTKLGSSQKGDEHSGLTGECRRIVRPALRG
jgi:hypothetical protein